MELSPLEEGFTGACGAYPRKVRRKPLLFKDI
jgi:hypothetical protein